MALNSFHPSPKEKTSLAPLTAPPFDWRNPNLPFQASYKWNVHLVVCARRSHDEASRNATPTERPQRCRRWHKARWTAASPIGFHLGWLFLDQNLLQPSRNVKNMDILKASWSGFPLSSAHRYLTKAKNQRNWSTKELPTNFNGCFLVPL